MKSTLFATLAWSAVLFAAPVATASEVPKVVASIKPVHSLVAGVMAGVGEPTLLVEGAGSPHTFSLKPSQARSISNADMVFWMGHNLETFLDKPLETLGSGAEIVELGEVDGLTLLEMREGGAFDAHQHGDDHDEHADHQEHEDHADHDDHGEDHADHEEHADHDDHEDHADHDDEEEHEHAHHDETDIHIWLDPRNAVVMTTAISEALSKADPDNAVTYKANAKTITARLAELEKKLSAELAPIGKKPFIVFHDAYHYFEDRFGVEAAGSITVSPEVMPGADRIADIRAKLKSTEAACVFSEPQFEPKLVAVVTENTDAKSGVLDPLGATLDPGPDLYFQLLSNLAGSMRDCLTQDN